VVLGNPPYVRQELLTPIKPYLQSHYQSYDGVADLYTYFYEKGVQILKPDGILCYIVTNKWFRSGYGEALRRFFTQNSVFEKIIDFGHAPIFKEADVFPCIVSLRKEDPHPPAPSPSGGEGELEKNLLPSPFGRGIGGEGEVQICSVPKEECLNANLTQYVSQNSFPVVWSRFSEKAWSLEPPAVEDLMQKIKQIGIPLKEFAGVKPYRGILTGFNEAFIIDNDTKQELVQADPKCAEIIKPMLRGQDIKRWTPEWKDIWIIFTRRGINIDLFPSVKEHLNKYRQRLEPCPKDWDSQKNGQWLGRKFGYYQWFEIQDTVDYWEMFEKPKILYQEINTLPSYVMDYDGFYANNKVLLLIRVKRYRSKKQKVLKIDQ